jgi:hypothetical protein
MKKARVRLRWTAKLLTVVGLMICVGGIGVFGSVNPTKNAPTSRADIISIDSMKELGRLDRRPVFFLHQKHTEALESLNKDCSTCHLSEKNVRSNKYMRLENTSRQALMDIYHDNCIGCHRETAAAKQKGGPVVCGECHVAQAGVMSSWQPIAMGNSLHYRHSKSQDKKCETCHHEYNAVTKKLFYAEGKEGTCRYCHRDTQEDNRESLRTVAHIACISCHQKNLAKNESAGPITCSGCHDPAQQKLIEVVQSVPRMKRNQPDFVFVKTSKAEGENSKPPKRMNLVPFNHKAHEGYNATCRSCHHADLSACVQCHTIQGSKEGDYVKLEQAMHRLKAQQSCVGCHERKQQEKACAGCHTSFEKKRQQDQLACQNCHQAEISLEAPQSNDPVAASRALESRLAMMSTFDDEFIPETVKINSLTDKYEPVKLPHRKIVNTLFKDTKDNKLAKYFHREKGTLCQGCHHNSPATKNPPKCGSCHGRPFNEKDPFKPGLMAAYHRQCMECHREMGIQKPVATNCTACHREKS